MSARPQVTITLGRSGQVVKRAEPITDSELTRSSGGKRPVRERLGSHVDNSYSYESRDMNKRQRTENSNWNSGDHHSSSDKHYALNRRVGRHDLRFKLISKSLSRKNSTLAQEHDVDRREKLSRSTQVPLRFDPREHTLRPRDSDLVRRISPRRSAADLVQLDSLRRPYSSGTLDGLRHRSPDRILGASRGVSPPRSYSELRHVPSIRSANASRPTGLMTNGVADVSRSAIFMSKPASVESAKPVLRAPPGGIMQKSSYMPEQPLTVASLLTSLGLAKYAILFQAEEVDMTALKQMGDGDLKELGIPMGPRKKILLAVLSRSKHRHR